ncbi:MAG: helix-turn-helix transcriptional regulator [Candidatus Pristimantibacillus sp.]
MSYMNIPYRLEKNEVSLSPFKSIWKVMANNTYQISSRKGFDSPGLFITYEGNGTLTLLNDTYELNAGTFFFVQNAISTNYKCKNEDWKFYFLDFNSLEMPNYLQLPICKVVSTGKMTEALQLCEQLIDLLISQPLGYEFSANIKLQEVCLLFAREQTIGVNSRHTEINKILIYIHRNIDKQIRIEELIQLSGLSRTSFFTRFRSTTGLSPSNYMLKLKLESAKVSLETTNLSVKEIAANLNFYDEFHFSKLYKKSFGMSPRKFRNIKDSGHSN